MQPATPLVIAESLCRLEAQFDNLMRFEELIMKKVRDNEIRYGNAKQRNEVSSLLFNYPTTLI